MSRSLTSLSNAALLLLRVSISTCLCALALGCGADDDRRVTTSAEGDSAAPGEASPSGVSVEAGADRDAGPTVDAALAGSGLDGSTTALGACSLGEASSLASDQSLDLFGNITYFAKGKDLPPGRYRVEYVDGCMKFSPALPWSVNNAFSSGWWLVGASSSERIVGLPGDALNGFLGGLFGGFEACVTTNKQLPPREFDFAGGKLGIWLDDGPYTDNQAGEGGRNPTWRLTLLVQECPPELTLL